MIVDSHAHVVAPAELYAWQGHLVSNKANPDAGAPTLMLSLWTVDDEATAELMSDFYKRLLAGARPAAALRSAQLRQMRARTHPFFWSAFVLTGRW